jgi:hypothetical protein
LSKPRSQSGHTHHYIDGHHRAVIMLSFNTSPDDKSMMTLSDFRRIALTMPETVESNGMGYPNFRTGRKSFATIEDSTAVIRLTRDQQATFVAAAPEVFAPDSSGWGRLGSTVIRLEVADEATVQVAVATAWSNVAEVVNASEVVDVADVEIATEFINAAEVVEASDAADVAEEVSAAEVPNGAEVVEIKNAAVSVEPRDDLLRVIERMQVSWGR